MRTFLTSLLLALLTLPALAQRDGDHITITEKNGTQTPYALTGTSNALSSLRFNAQQMDVYLKGLEDFGAWQTVAIDNLASVTFSVYKESDLSGVTLADASATDPTKRLFRYIRNCYGHKTLSSVIADVNWNHTLADQIHQKTGRYPAFNCYDFIHIYVPENNGWIDYNDITPVTEWAEAGGLVQLMWHFNVPRSETTEIKANGDGVTCSPSETTFRPSNALRQGTWENRYYEQELAKVEAVLLRLQAQGISAVWRPYHEAAGNATLLSGADWGKAWFWWGSEGADVFKQLWRDMFTRFQQAGIHNLIWTWTSQNANLDAAQYAADSEWYPGDEYVDIIGRDLYGTTAEQQSREFAELTARYPGKLVALAECGDSDAAQCAKVSETWQAGARWAWFMPWYGASMPSDQWLAAAMSDPNVITREAINLSQTYFEETAADACRNMGLGFNMGNALEAWATGIADHQDNTAVYETCWGQRPVTEAQLRFLKAQGFASVRIPVTWLQHIDDDGNIDEAWLARVEQVVDWALDAGLYVIINVHHDTAAGERVWVKADAATYAANSERYKRLWRQIATRFRDRPARLLFEGYNEMLDAANTWNAPKDAASYDALNAWARDFVETVRATGGNNATRNLIVNTYASANSQPVLDALTLPEQPGHIAVEVHSYDPWDWFARGPWTQACHNELTQMFTRLNQTFATEGYPVIIGEYGTSGSTSVSAASSADQIQAAADQAADMVAQAKALGMATYYWMSVFDGTDRDTPRLTLPTVVEAMRQAWR